MGNVYYGQTFSIQLRRTVDNIFDLQGDPKKTEPIYFCLKFINFILAVWLLWWPVVPTRRGDPPHIKSHPWPAEKAISGKADQQEVWRRVGTSFTRFETPPPRFLTVGVSEGQCVSEQSSNNRWTQCCYCSKNQGNPQRGGRASDWQILRNGCESVSNAKDVIWNKFWREHKFCAKHSRLLKLWVITIHRQKFKCTKLE